MTKTFVGRTREKDTRNAECSPIFPEQIERINGKVQLHDSNHPAMITIPDTIYGAVIISLVDFILSFAIISGIGVILALLPIVNRFWNIEDSKLRGGH